MARAVHSLDHVVACMRIALAETHRGQLLTSDGHTKLNTRCFQCDKRTGDHDVEHDAARPHVAGAAVEEVVHERLRRRVRQRAKRALRIAVHLPAEVAER